MYLGDVVVVKGEPREAGVANSSREDCGVDIGCQCSLKMCYRK